MLLCLDVHNTEVMIHRQIVRHLTNHYDTECRALFRRRNPPGNALEKILQDRFTEVQTAKPPGRQSELSAGTQGRGGQGTGGNCGSRRGNCNNGGRRGGRGGRGTQGAK